MMREPIRPCNMCASQHARANREIYLTLTETLNDGNRAQVDGVRIAPAGAKARNPASRNFRRFWTYTTPIARVLAFIDVQISTNILKGVFGCGSGGINCQKKM